jgi:hypothetical protein
MARWLAGLFFISVPEPETGSQIPQPPAEGLQAGGLKPPEPVGIPLGRMAPADMSFSTSLHWQFGQTGESLLEPKTSCSKQWQQALH